MAKRTNRHHIRPRSRFPPDTPKEDKDRDNIVELDEEFHRAWHRVMGNLTPEEAHEFIDIIMTPNTVWSGRKIHHLRKSIRNKERS